METNVPSVHVVPGYSNSYIIDGDQGVTLIDTGLPNRQTKVVEVLSGIGRSIADVRAIVVTHSHADHVGGAAVLKRESQAPLFASPIDAPAIQGKERTPPPPIVGRFSFLRPLFRERLQTLSVR